MVTPDGSPPHTVTLDCWSTLIYEEDHRAGLAGRVASLQQHAARAGVQVDEDTARRVLHDAWMRHNAEWEAVRASGSPEIARWSLAALGVDDPAVADDLGRAFSDEVLDRPVHVLDGAGDTLEALRSAGVRTALVCDTGFSPGSSVRVVLERLGLAPLLEVLVFSNEVGVPKPHRSMFAAALDGLGVDAAGAVHVGDLRRTDVAGGRGAGMGTVRIAWHNDDRSELPDGDAVAESHAHLRELLGFA